MRMKVEKWMTWRNFKDICGIMGVIIALYTAVYLPWMEKKPDLEFFTTPHYIGNNTAISSILIRNKGDAAATNIGIYFELTRPYTIKEIRSNLKYDLVEGGEGDWKVKMMWDRLEPRNTLNLSIFIEADPVDILSIIPVILRVWSDSGILEEQGFNTYT